MGEEVAVGSPSILAVDGAGCLALFLTVFLLSLPFVIFIFSAELLGLDVAVHNPDELVPCILVPAPPQPLPSV